MKLITALALTAFAFAANAATPGVAAASTAPAAKSAAAAPLKCAKGYAKVKALKVTMNKTPGYHSVDYAGKTDSGGMLMTHAEFKKQRIAVGVEFCAESPDPD